MEDTVSIKDIIAVVKKRIILILVMTLTVTLIGALASYYYITPTYQVSTQLLVNHARAEEPGYDIDEIQTNLELINTYSVIIKSPVILEKVREDLNLNESVEALNSMISVVSRNKSQVIRIKVKNTDYQKASEIANKTGEVFQKEIVSIMNFDNVSVLTHVQQNSNPVPISPNHKLNIAFAFVFGVLASVSLTIFLEYFDNTIKSESEIEKQLNIPVLGKVSKIKGKLTAENKFNEVHTGIKKETLES
ncbi:Wzz/FepE/Etk N-terminal domain-containing protein [Bacillus gobiensis]|uniref:YveK family protein n=1 Tax=Bacillus gobiensis TaxID=1441095 RepID=UPI003D20FE96